MDTAASIGHMRFPWGFLFLVITASWIYTDCMQDQVEKKRLTILRVLNEYHEPVSSNKITEILTSRGYQITERTVRFHLSATDNAGLTVYREKYGREITDLGRQELQKARVQDKVGFLSSRINQMNYSMTFNMQKKTGSVVVNISLIPKEHWHKAVPLMQRVYSAGYAMGELCVCFAPGDVIGDLKIPNDTIGIGTVCSITLNGILLARGIPVDSRFGGLLEIEGGIAQRFVEIINYNGTTIDPLEIFIKSGMTDYLGATSTGFGLIGASFREIPAAAREQVAALDEEMRDIGLGCIHMLGNADQELLRIPVSVGGLGAVVIGGLNPVAILEESGMSVDSKALSGLVPFEQLIHYKELSSLKIG